MSVDPIRNADLNAVLASLTRYAMNSGHARVLGVEGWVILAHTAQVYMDKMTIAPSITTA
jgi:hypothetical protein